MQLLKKVWRIVNVNHHVYINNFHAADPLTKGGPGAAQCSQGMSRGNCWHYKAAAVPITDRRNNFSRSTSHRLLCGQHHNIQILEELWLNLTHYKQTASFQEPASVGCSVCALLLMFPLLNLSEFLLFNSNK